jgi:hypothetical protein
MMGTADQISETFDAKFQALQIVAKMAYEFVNELQPGDRFFGLQSEAAQRFDIGSEGYGLFVGCALHHMSKFVMDVDADRRIVSIVRVKNS